MIVKEIVEFMSVIGVFETAEKSKVCGSRPFVRFQSIVDNWNDEAGEGRGNLHVGNCQQYSKHTHEANDNYEREKKHLWYGNRNNCFYCTNIVVIAASIINVFM